MSNSLWNKLLHPFEVIRKYIILVSTSNLEEVIIWHNHKKS
jgi:hypothetical protein